MVGMMKQNVSMILPNILMMGWVSYFFSGFVLGIVVRALRFFAILSLIRSLFVVALM